MGQSEVESGTARREGHRSLATEGLSVREISEKTGHPKSTVHRDLAGWEPSQKDVAKQEAARLTAEADQLVARQQELRGLLPGPTVDGEQTKIPGPYERTPENEDRARKVIALRKQAADLLPPL